MYRQLLVGALVAVLGLPVLGLVGCDSAPARDGTAATGGSEVADTGGFVGGTPGDVSDQEHQPAPGTDPPESPGSEGSPDADGDDDAPSDGVYEPVPAECDVPTTLPADPLTQLGSLWVRGDDDGGFRVHLLDLDVDPSSDVVYGAGLGGVLAFTEADGQPDLIGSYRVGENDYEHVLVAAPGLVLASSRNHWVIVLNTDDPTKMSLYKTLPVTDVAGMATDGAYTWAVTLDGRLLVIRTADPTQTSIVDELTGLANAHEIVLGDDDWAYVADNTLGVVPVDVSAGNKPVLGTPVATVGGAQGIDHDSGYVYVAAGTAGVQVFDVDNPAQPVPVGVWPIGQTAVSVHWADSRVWATNHADVVVLDASQPTSLTPIATEPTEEWAMDVFAIGTKAYVANWGYLDVVEIDPAAAAPDASLVTDTLYFTGGSAETTVDIENHGNAPLHISGLNAGDPRVTVEVSASTVPSGGSATLTLTFEDDGEPVSSAVCVATDDPDEPLLELHVLSTSGGATLGVGEPAVDFTLDDLDGTPHTLSKQLGKPVLLAYFATW